MKALSVIVLAGGLGKRMRSGLPKVLHPICGVPMGRYPLESAKSLKPERIVILVGHHAERVKEAFRGEPVGFAHQPEQLGTGDAVAHAMKLLDGFKGDVLVLSGDVPLVTTTTLKALVRFHRKEKGAVTFISTILDEPTGYGRVLRDEEGRVCAIVEEKDLKGQERALNEVNAGIYVFDAEFLRENITRLRRNNKQGEYYLTDLVGIAIERGYRVAALTHTEPQEVMGVNTRVELAEAERLMQQRILQGLMLSGVTIKDPSNTYIDYGVRVGRDTTIHPCVYLYGDTRIGRGCTIEEGVKVKDSRIGDGTTIKSFTVIEDSRIGKNVTIGPFARLRPECRIDDDVRIGNFVEVKKSHIKEGSKANHHSYLGDATIGKGVNIGAGTITCNYDGRKKHRTIIKDGAFIGSDTQLVAPVTVGKGAYIGAGSTITKDVPDGALSLSRPEQKIIKGWVKRRMES